MALISTMMESYGTLKRPTVGRDTAQGVTSTPFVTVAVNLPCSVSQMSASAQLLYAQRNVFISTVIYLAVDPGANVNDVFDATDRLGNVTRYLVKDIFGSDTRSRLFSMGCEAIREPK